MLNDLQEIVLNRFINRTLKMAPSRDHRAFRDDIEEWLASLKQDEVSELVLKLRGKSKHQTLQISRQMYQLFSQKTRVFQSKTQEATSAG